MMAPVSQPASQMSVNQMISAEEVCSAAALNADEQVFGIKLLSLKIRIIITL